MSDIDVSRTKQAIGDCDGCCGEHDVPWQDCTERHAVQDCPKVEAAARQDCRAYAESQAVQEPAYHRTQELLAEALREVWALYEPDPRGDDAYAACLENLEEGGITLEMSYVAIRAVRDALAAHDRQAAP